jgi:hypothetical protein
MHIPEARVAEVARRLTSRPEAMDSLDAVEEILDLEEEFGSETVRRAIRFIEAFGTSSTTQFKPAPSKTSDCLWDPDLDV